GGRPSALAHCAGARQQQEHGDTADAGHGSPNSSATLAAMSWIVPPSTVAATTSRAPYFGLQPGGSQRWSVATWIRPRGGIASVVKAAMTIRPPWSAAGS